ncbi:serine hydrolase domain-containing protein [Lactobacillus terrae]|uniref:serine hydrolase domain-containing protein n=1 Tax=Lactobacillus terrae TaxID=2269374 RepID=UPI000C1B6031|nr:serine hydrolase domain-containing protein [Lactobacillus terrae]
MFENTRSQLISLVNEQVCPGVSMGFIDHGKMETEYLGAKSWLPTYRPIDQESFHDLASLTKVMVTAPMIKKLVEEGKLSYSDPINKYLPEFKDDRVQVINLLTHTSGIKGYITDRDSLNGEELVKALLKLPVTADFNKKVVYTDTGMIFLGLIIERIIGGNFQEIVQTEILDNWGLYQTTFNPDPQICVPTYKLNGDYMQGIPNDPKARQLGVHCGSAGLFATLNDVMKFAEIMLENKDYYQNLTELNPGRSYGWNILTEDGNILFHTGYTGHFIELNYEKQRAMVVLTNRVHPVENNQKFLIRRQIIRDSFMNEK